MRIQTTHDLPSFTGLLQEPLRRFLDPVEPAIERLSDLVADLERDGKGVPILLRQYLKTGGKLLAFNIDRGFSGVLDALIMVDLRSAPAAILERYFGKAGAGAFQQWHREHGRASQ